MHCRPAFIKSFLAIICLILIGLGYEFRWRKSVQQIVHKFAQPPGFKFYMPKEKQNIDRTVEPDPLRAHVSRYSFEYDFTCTDMRRFGGPQDGGWTVCFGKGMEISQPCLVYSFGIANDWTFDYAISEHLGCEVHSFDMTLPINTSLPKSKTAKVTFHRLGLSGADAHKTKTLKTIRRMLGHTNSIIDYLKVDVEGDEWSSLSTALNDGSLTGVRQLGLEIHMNKKGRSTSWPPTSSEQLSILLRLHQLGFMLYEEHANPYDFNCWELSYARTMNHKSPTH